MIRNATPEDLPALYSLIESYYKEARATRGYLISFKWEKVANQIWTWLHNKNCVIFLADHGMLAGNIQETWFGETVVAHLEVCYVERPFRNGITARRLINRFNQIAEERGAICSFWDDWAGITEGDMLEQYLEKLGYSIQGHVYRKDFANAVHCPIYSPYCSGSGAAVS